MEARFVKDLWGGAVHQRMYQGAMDTWDSDIVHIPCYPESKREVCARSKAPWVFTQGAFLLPLASGAGLWYDGHRRAAPDF